MATNATPTFEPTGNFNGSWYGVAQVDVDEEIARLRAAACVEITEAEYQDALKKKAVPQGSLDDFRPVLAVNAALAVKPESKVPPPPEIVIADQVKQAAPIPPRRRSTPGPG